MGSGPLVGRRAELARLRSWAGSVRGEGAAAAVTVMGEAGVGKTALVDELGAELGRDGFEVLRSGITQVESGLAWAGLGTLLAGLPGDALEVLPEGQRRAVRRAVGADPDPVGEASPTLVAAGLAGLVRHRAGRRPLVLVLDDAVWLDRASAAAISYALRAAAAAPVLTVATARGDGVLPVEPRRLLPPGRAQELVLSGVSVAALHQILVDSLELALRRPDLIRLHELTAGNPLYATEIGRLIRAGGTVDESRLPPSLHAAISQRLAMLDPSALRVLQGTALLASGRVGDLRAALPEEDVDAALMAAEGAGIVRVRGDVVHFDHPLVGWAVLEGAGGLRSRQLAARLAAVVSDLEQRAVLLGLACIEPDQSAAEALERAAGHAAARGAAHVAAQRFDRAEELTPPGDRVAARRRALNAAGAWLDAADFPAAQDRADRVLALAQDGEELLMAGRTGVLAAGYLGEWGRAQERARTLVARLAQHPGPRLEALRTLVRLLQFTDLREAERIAQAAVAEADQVGTAEQASAAQVALAHTRFLRGQPLDASVVPQRPTMDAAHLRNHTAAWFSAELLTWSDSVAAAIDVNRTEMEQADAAGLLNTAQGAREDLADALWRAGLWDRAAAVLREGLDIELVRATDRLPLWHADLARLLAAQGRCDEAGEVWGTAPPVRTLPPLAQISLSSRLASAALACGRAAEAVEHGREARRIAAEVGYADLGTMPFRADLVDALLQVGLVTEAAEVAAEHQELARVSGLPRGRAESARSAGMVAAAQRRTGAALELLEQALAAHEGLSVPLELGRTQLALGSLLRRTGRRADARAHLDEARGIFHALGAGAWVQRADAERARLGTRRAGPAGVLSPTERRVAELVLAGRSNAQIAAELFISGRTVESNLTRVYRTLGVHSRTELAARGLPPG